MGPEDARAVLPTDAPGPEHAFEPTLSRSPWWAGGPIRLGLLLTGLAAALFALLSMGGGPLDLGGRPSQATGAAFAPGCPGRDAPAVASITVGDLAALHDAVARVMPPRVGRVYEEGTVLTSNLWTDNLPQLPSTSPARSVPAGYEIRWWALDRDGNEDDVVADVFELATHRQAQEVLLRATNTRCRRDGEAHAALLPSGAGNLAWLNPDDAEESDVLLVRGRRLYRVVDVPPSYPPPTGPRQRRLEQLTVERTVDVLACALPDAGCPATADSARPPGLATLAASSSAQPRSRRPVTRGQASTYAHAVNLRGYDLPQMTAVTRESPTENLGYRGEFARCTGEGRSTHTFHATQSPTFSYIGRREGGFVYSTVAVFSSEASADRHLAVLASARTNSCIASSYQRRLLSRHGQRDRLRVGRIVAARLPAPAPASYRGLGPYRGTALRLTIPISYTTKRGRHVQVDSYFEGFAFAYGRAVIALAAESELRPFARADEQYLITKLMGRAEAYEGDLPTIARPGGRS